jgi:outer membrane protein assembly factor BamB
MSDIQTGLKEQTADASAPTASGRFKPLRIWPPLLLLVGMVVTWLLPRVVEDAPAGLWMSAVFGPAVCGILVMLWWLLFSRATALERFAGILGTGVVVAVTLSLIDKSMLGPGIMILTIPMGTAAFAIGAILFGRVLSFKRTVVAVLLAACGFGFSDLLRSEGMWGDFVLGWDWRWQPSPEERMLAWRKNQPATERAEFAADDTDQWLADPEWPGFRGADRTSRQHGPAISTDWSTSPPEQIWKILVGPGWSSFAVAGNLLFTQEQRGPLETIVCYAADSGREIWTQEVETRFDDPLGGPGPRATPTLADGGLFAQGSNGQLQRLDPKSGDVVWVQDLRKVADREPPMWGFSSSPLVVGAVVIVHAGGRGDKGIVAFDVETGDLKWSAAAGDHSYSSPQLCIVGENEFALMLTNTGIKLLDPVSGQEHLSYTWEHRGYRALQPQVVDGDSILLPTGMGVGTRRIRVSKNDKELSVEESWTSRHLKPDFNDFVVHREHGYGFDGAIFTCIDLATGLRKWKGGRYGKGQVLLLADSDLLLVTSEYGEVLLLKADPSGHRELAKFPALEGKTWNHPVVIGDRLYIRNAQEAACYRLPMVTGAVETPEEIPST